MVRPQGASAFGYKSKTLGEWNAEGNNPGTTNIDYAAFKNVGRGWKYAKTRVHDFNL